MRFRNGLCFEASVSYHAFTLRPHVSSPAELLAAIDDLVYRRMDEMKQVRERRRVNRGGLRR